MATIRRAGFGTIFELEDSKVGIGTDAATHTLQALGNIRSEAATDIGISSLTTYQGFADKEARFTTGQIDIESQSGSTSGEVVIDGDVTVSSATTFTSGPQHLTVTDTFTLPSGDTNSRETKPTSGSLRFNQDFATLEFYTGNNWATVNTFTEMQNSPGNRGRAVHAGGADPSPNSYTDFMSAFEMATQGNAVDFGSLLKAGQGHEGLSSSTRGLFTGRKTPSANPDDDIEYFTIASGGQTIFFGNLSSARRLAGTFSSSTRGIVAGGLSPSYLNIIDYVEISTLGNALDFGDTMSTEALNAGCSSPTKGIFNGGRSGGGTWVSRVEEVTIASKGNSVKFGDLTYDPGSNAAFSNSIRGFFAGGHTNPNYNGIDPGPIDYISLASGGNGFRFGDLSSRNSSCTGTASQTRGFIMGGNNPAITNLIEFVTIATTGNAMDFGDLVNKLESGGSLSDSHGGLGGF